MPFSRTQAHICTPLATAQSMVSCIKWCHPSSKCCFEWSTSQYSDWRDHCLWGNCLNRDVYNVLKLWSNFCLPLRKPLGVYKKFTSCQQQCKHYAIVSISSGHSCIVNWRFQVQLFKLLYVRNCWIFHWNLQFASSKQCG